MASNSTSASNSNKSATIGAESELSGEAITNSVYAYVLRPLLNKVDVNTLKLYPYFNLENDGQKLIEEIMNQSDHALRMYGTAKDLAKEIKIFRNFPKSHVLLQIDNCNPYTTTPITYTSLSGQTYMCKNDVFIVLQNIVKENCEIYELGFVQALVAIFLKHHEKKLENVNEFINTSDDSFKNLDKAFKTLVVTRNPQTMKLVTYTFKEVLENYKKLIPGEWDSEEYCVFKNLLKIYFKEKPIRRHATLYKGDYKQCADALNSLEAIMNNRPEIFLPNKNTKNNANSKIVRIFQDADKQFVPVDEIPEQLESSKENEPNQEYIWNTKDLSCIPEALLKQSKDPKFEVQFLKVPIVRGKHRASYIMNRNGDFHLLAIDVFYEMLRNWIFGLKLFQRIRTEDDWKLVWAFMAEFKKFDDKFFDWEQKNIYFLHNEAINEIYSYCDDHFKTLLTRPAKDVRNAKVTGFTEENLKNELKHLGLLTAFPNIHENVKKVYAHVLKHKKGDVLRTCDLFDAVYHCQMISFLKELPKYADFIHNQNGCSRVLETTCLCNFTKTMNEAWGGGWNFGRIKANRTPVVLASNLPEEEQKCDCNFPFVVDFRKQICKKNCQ